jgi:hypothetical protein
MTDSMESPLGINGSYSGGPLDGLTYFLQVVPGFVGATLVVQLSQRERDETRGHLYRLVPFELTSQMQYDGEATATDLP